MNNKYTFCISPSLDPVIVQPAAPWVKMTSLLFTSHTDCIVVGDSVGKVTVYLLKNMNIGEGNQVTGNICN